MAREVRVALGERAYDVVVAEEGYAGLGARIASTWPGRRVVLVWDERIPVRWPDAVVAELEGAGLRVAVVAAQVSEQQKTIQTWSRVVDDLLASGVDRRTPVLALGGGVLGDIAGFAAATTLRGLPLVQLPTTLLSMVDSSVGGKTGVNHAHGKNLVGAFHQPGLVWASVETLETLPPEELAAGFGEVVKSALIADEPLFEQLEAGDVPLTDVIARCVRVKASVVERDEREGGWRAVLNAGHTLGHAYEWASGYSLAHGRAVAQGLVDEAAWAVRAGHCEDEELPRRLRDVFARLGVEPVRTEAAPEELISAMVADKKVDADVLAVPVAERVGRMRLVRLPVAQLRALLPC